MSQAKPAISHSRAYHPPIRKLILDTFLALTAAAGLGCGLGLAIALIGGGI